MSKIVKLLKQAQEVSPEDLFLIEDKIERYPYFHSLYFLHSKALQETAPETFEKSLQKAALYAPNRAVLYEFLHQPTEETNIVAPETETNIDAVVEKISTELENETLETKPTVSLSDSQKPTIELEEKSLPIEKFEDTEPQFDEISKEDIAEEVIIQEKESSAQEIDRNILQIVADENTPGKDIENQEIGNYSFSEWLHSVAPISENKDEIDRKKKETQKKFEIIDEFLDKNPKISSPREFQASQPQKPLQQKDTMSHLMTETLANIYMEQHKYDKAIKAYTILRLKYPKKSGYFADRINEIKELKNKK